MVKNADPRWSGETAICIASGPSLTREDVSFVRGRGRTIAVNREFEFAPWADVCYAADYRFWNFYIREGLKDTFSGELWTVDKKAAEQFNLNFVRRGFGEGYSMIAGTINTGGNSGYQAIHLAAYWRASRIVLLGYDMQRTGNKEHHYGVHKGSLPNGRGFPFWIKRMRPLFRDLKKLGIEVINATRETAIPESWCQRLTVDQIKW